MYLGIVGLKLNYVRAARGESIWRQTNEYSTTTTPNTRLHGAAAPERYLRFTSTKKHGDRGWERERRRGAHHMVLLATCACSAAAEMDSCRLITCVRQSVYLSERVDADWRKYLDRQMQLPDAAASSTN